MNEYDRTTEEILEDLDDLTAFEWAFDEVASRVDEIVDKVMRLQVLHIESETVTE